MANTAVPKGEITVDSRGRTSLRKVRSRAFGRYWTEEHPDGTLVLTPMAVLPAAELEQLRDRDARLAGLEK